jgi:hypothetical protein
MYLVLVVEESLTFLPFPFTTLGFSKNGKLRPDDGD